MKRARGELVLFTDDDCRVPADWIQAFRYAFADSRMDMAYGQVTLRGAGRGGWGAAFSPRAPQVHQRIWPRGDDGWGLGANMGIRRSAMRTLTGFDPMLGAGSELEGGEDVDLQMRALDSGLRLLHTPVLSVDHYGVRYGDEARRLILTYSSSFGATLAKQVQLGSPVARRYMGRLLVSKAAVIAARMARLKGPQGARQVLALVRGYRCLQRTYAVRASTGWLVRRSL